MRTPPLRVLAGALACALLACSPAPEAAAPAPDAKIAPELAAALLGGGSAEVLVVLDEEQLAGRTPDYRALTLIPGDQGAELRARRFGAAKQELLAALESAPLVRRDFSHLPLLHVAAGSAEVAALAARPEVASLHLNLPHRHFLTESLPLVHQPQALAAGASGAGTSVAILDTGLDYTRAAFGSCTGPNTPSSCKVAFVQDFAPDDGSLDDNGHGTNVAGIVLGVAPQAKVLGLDVFNGQSAWSSDIIAAINWVIANRATYNIVAMNLSLGGGASTTACSGDVFAAPIAQAKAAGVAAAIASGNNGYSNQISSPGCVPAAISVGAVYDSSMGGTSFSVCSDASTAADKITCFSNSASFLTLLAPGAMITAAGVTMAGTSQATPHVAGAIAALRSKFPSETVDQTVQRLTSTGTPIRDARNGVTVPRIDVAAAAGASGGGGQTDTTPPSGSVTINGGATAVASASVTLTLAATDPSGVPSVCVSNWSTCPGWRTFATSISWTLAGTGLRGVYVWFKDGLGNTTSTPITAVTTVDTAGPTGGAVTTTPGDSQVGLSWSGFTDATTGVASYKVVAQPGAAPTSCSGGTSIYSGTATTATATGLANGTSYGFRVCGVDLAGNVGAGVTVSATPVSATADSTPPTGTVVINGGASVVASANVTLTLAASDPSGVPSVCISNWSTCPGWRAFATSIPWTLAGTGLRGVYVWFKDGAGNVSASPITAVATVDTAGPTGGAVTATAGDAQVALAWSGFTDATTSVASYKVVAQAGAAPPACSSGTAVYTGSATSATATGLANCTSYGFRVCGVDQAGNLGAGVTASATPAAASGGGGSGGGGGGGADTTPPSGTVAINGGASFVSSVNVTLTLAATDPSGVPSVCVSNWSTCTAWRSFATSIPWTLAGTGARGVYVWFKDGAGNASASPITAVTNVDATAPVDGTLRVTPSSGGNVSLAWSGWSDAGSGIASYKVVSNGTTTAPAPGCGAGALVYAGTATGWSGPGLTPGAKYSFRVCAIDGAGNVSAGASATITAL